MTHKDQNEVVRNEAANFAFRSAYNKKHASRLSKLFSPIALRIARRRLAQLRGKTKPLVVKIFTGQEMHVILPEVVSGSIYTYGFFDECVTSFILHAVRPGDTVLDIGAHFGFFSVLASHLVGPTGHVVSFEPTPSTFTQLSKNVESCSNVEVHNIAIGKTESSATVNDFGLEYCAWNFMGDDHRVASAVDQSFESIEVSVRTIDELVRESGLTPTVIKIDTENFEEEVFLGARQTIADHVRVVIIEAKSEYSKRVGQALSQLGFEPHKLTKDYQIAAAQGDWNTVNYQEANFMFLRSN